MLILVSMNNYILIDVKNAIYNIDVNVRKYSGHITYVIRINIYTMHHKQARCKKAPPTLYFETDICFSINILIEVICYFMTIFLSNIKLLIMISFLQIIIQFSCMNVYTCNIVPSHDTNYIRKKNTAFYIDEVRLEPGKC